MKASAGKYAATGIKVSGNNDLISYTCTQIFHHITFLVHNSETQIRLSATLSHQVLGLGAIPPILLMPPPDQKLKELEEQQEEERKE